MFAIVFFTPKFTQKFHPKEQNCTNLTKNGPERPSGPNFAPRFIRAPAVHMIGLHAPSFFPKPKPRNQGNEGQPGCTHRNSTHTATETEHNSQPETTKGSWPLLLPRRRRRCCCCCCCCCCAAAVLLLLHDPRRIVEHNPSQQTVSRFVFFENACRSE